MRAVLLRMKGLMRVPAKDSIRSMMLRILQRARSHLPRHPQPPRVQPVNPPRHRISLQIELLQLQVQRCSHPAQPHPVHLKTVELVAVNRNVLHPVVLPAVILVHAHAHQMRHHVGQPVVVIPFHPHHFNVALGIRQLPDISQKLPMILGKPREVKVGKNVAQQNQPREAALLEHLRSLARATRLRTQVQVRKDQRVVRMQIHILVVPTECYGVMKDASILVHLITLQLTPANPLTYEQNAYPRVGSPT